MIIKFLILLLSLNGYKAELLIASKGNKLICIGTNGTIPTWILPTERNSAFNYKNNIEGKWSSEDKNSLNCNFNKENSCNGWIYDTTKVSSADGFLTGYLWNDLNILQTKPNNPNEIDIKTSGKEKNYFVSILAKNNAYLNFINNENNSGYLRIVIATDAHDKSNAKTKLFYQANKSDQEVQCTSTSGIECKGVQLNDGKTWEHFKLSFSYSQEKLKVIKIFTSRNNTHPLTEWSLTGKSIPDGVFDKLEFSTDNKQPGYWKLHQLQGLLFNSGSNVKLIKKEIKVDKSELCIEVSYTSIISNISFYIDGTGSKHITVKLDETKTMKEKRIFYNNLIPNTTYEIGIKADKIFTVNIFAIRECSANEYYNLILSNYNEKNLSCIDSQNIRQVTMKNKTGTLLQSNCNNADVFGSNCNINCNDLFDTEGCKGVTVCNSRLCSCVPGYYGTNCENECEGKYGVNCDKDCGNCKNNIQCNYYDGKCPYDECQPGYKTSFCNQPCDDGTYGENCKQTCSDNCLGEKYCDKTDGECAYGCKEGYSPPDCRDVLLQLNHQPLSNKTLEDKVVFYMTQNDIIGNISKLQDISVTCNDTPVNAPYEKHENINTFTVTIYNLIPNTEYYCKIKLTEVNGKIGIETYIEFKTVKSSKNNPDSTMIWIIIILILLGLIITGVIFYIKKPSVVMNNLNRLQVPIMYFNRDNNTLNVPPNTNNRPIPSTSTTTTTTACITTNKVIRSTVHTCRINVNQFKQYVQDSIQNDLLKTQHSKFPRGQTQPWIEGKKSEHKGKNRYGNLVAYDATRVILQILPNQPHSHYINANYIDGYIKPKEYIATQGPKPQTLDDFWRMIWQENVSLIIMLANLVETGKVKCEKYWSDLNKTIKHANITIQTKKEDVFIDYTIREIIIAQNSIERKVTQLHYTSWPDHGVPRYPHTLAHFLLKIIEHKSPGPIVVHCSAGVGRTGTILLAHSCYKMALEENAIDCLQLIAHMRSQRPNMVDNEHQYILTHKLLVELLFTKNTLITKEEFLIKSRTMKERDLCEEFAELHNTSLNDVQDGSHPHDTRKDRYPNIVAGAEGRVILNKPIDNYINAIYVDGIRKQDQFIITQLPLPQTINDFWSMVVDKASVIIFLNQHDPRDPTTAMLWTEHNALHSTDFRVSILEKQPSKKYHDVITLRIQDLEHCLCKDIPVITVKNWNKSEFIPPARSELIFNLWDEIGKIQVDKSIVVVCHDGCTASGLFVAGIHIIEYLKATNYVNIGHSIRSIRHHRRQLIKSIEQYKFLYGLVLSYFDYFETYADI